MNQTELLERVLYPVTRVRAGQVGGSGVLVYSQPDPKDDRKYINIVLTCEHVVDGNIKVKEDWDPVLKRQVKKDFLEEVSVEVFDYDASRLVSKNASDAAIVAYDQHNDLAAIRLYNTKPLPYVAPIYAKDKVDQLQLFDPVWICGCSLGHDPIPSSGMITYLREIIEQKPYLMTNADAIFGNSGGALYHTAGELLGLVSRVTVTQMGFGLDVQTWMNFSTHPARLYEFFQHQELQFLVDPADNYYDAMERREKKRRASMRELLLGEQDGQDTPKKGD